jgi:hypothetical protein
MRAVETTALRISPTRQPKQNCQSSESGTTSSDVIPIRMEEVFCKYCAQVRVFVAAKLIGVEVLARAPALELLSPASRDVSAAPAPVSYRLSNG